MTHRRFVPLTLAAALLLVATAAVVLPGCTSEPDRDHKREIDRLAIDLTRAQKERDQYKAELERAKADSGQDDQAIARIKQELADTQRRLRQTEDDLAAARRQLRDAQPAGNAKP